MSRQAPARDRRSPGAVGLAEACVRSGMLRCAREGCGIYIDPVNVPGATLCSVHHRRARARVA